MNKIEKILCENPWVQSPMWNDVEKLLSALTADMSYLQRGSKEASEQLIKVEAIHRRWVSDVVNLESFPYCYITAGATEALNQWRLTDKREWQYLSGDYLWPQIVSGNGLEIEDVDQLQKDRVLYISNPSCRNGNFLTEEDIMKIDRCGCPVILDCAYVGSVKRKRIKIFQQTEQIFFSFSKGWGLVGQRMGLLYSKVPHTTLRHMRRVECWNYLVVQIMNLIMREYQVDSMYLLAKIRQEKICSYLNLKPSDTYFLATSENPIYRKQRRGSETARLCLTPLWFDLEF